MPHEVDVYVGKRIKTLRGLRKISQEKLAHEMGVTFQQVQKYENGTNRISASRLVKISEALGVGVSELFGKFDSGAESMLDNLTNISKHDLNLAISISEINSSTLKRSIEDIIKNLSKR